MTKPTLQLFKAEDFKEIICYDRGEMIKKMEISEWIQNTIAEIANEILNKHLVRVYGKHFDNEQLEMSFCTFKRNEHTHSAYLLCAEELK